jgi:predicted small metal-binding protein
MSNEKRKVVDCRLYPSEKGCTLSIEGTEEEVLEAATQHAVTAHGHTNSPELREQIRTLLKDASE